MYCLKCKKNTGSDNEHIIMLKNKRMAKTATCADCGTKKNIFISNQKGNGIESSQYAQEAYKKPKKRSENIDDYMLDKDLSNKNIAVYKNAEGKAIVSNRGTDLTRKNTFFEDLKNDAKILVGKSDKINRVKKTQKITNELINQGYDVKQTGHSLGGRIAYEAAKKTGTTADIFSPGTSIFDKNKKKTEGITSYRTKNDPVASFTSKLNVKDEKIKQQGNNPHSLQQFVDKAKTQTGGCGMCKGNIKKCCNK